ETYHGRPVALAHQLADAPHAATFLSDAHVVDARVLPAASALRDDVAGHDWVAVGDSAASCDPISGWGIVKALRDGVACGHAVDRHLRSDPDAIPAYVASLRRSFERYRAQRRSIYEQERRWMGNGFWRRRIEG